MTLQSIPNFYWPLIPSNVTTTISYSTSTVRINSATDYVAVVLEAHRDIDLSKIIFRSGSITTGCTLDVRVETVLAGLPTNTLWDTNTNITQSVTTANTQFEATFTSPASIARGDTFAIVFRVSSGTPNNLQLPGLADAGKEFLPYYIRYDGSNNIINDVGPGIGLYDTTDGWIRHPGLYPSSAQNNETISSSTTPDVIGNKITIPVAMSISGFWVWADIDQTTTAKLLDSAGSVLATKSLDVDVPPIATGNIHPRYFNTEIELTAGDDYYLIFEPDSTSNFQAYSAEQGSSDYVTAGFGGGQMAFCSAKNPTVIGDYTVSTTKVLFCGLIVSKLSDTVSGGGGGEHSFASMS